MKTNNTRTHRWLSFMNAFSQGISGSDACFINIAKQLSKKNIDLTIFTSLMGKHLCQENNIKANYVITSKEKVFSNVYLIYMRRVVNVLRNLKTVNNGIVYSTSDFLPDVLPAFFSRLNKGRNFWVQKIFHLIPKDRMIPHLSQIVSFFLIRLLCDLVIVDNKKLLEALVIKYKFNPNKLTYIPPGIDVTFVKGIKRSERYFDGIYMGQLRESKGIFDLIGIWKIVIAKFPKATLGIVGQDLNNNKERLSLLIKEQKLENNIYILGYLPQEDKYSLLKSAKILLLPSYEEGFGMVIVEAMVCGKYTLAYDLPIYDELFEGKVLTAELGNITKFAKKIIKHLSNKGCLSSTNFSDIYMKFDSSILGSQEIALIQDRLLAQENSPRK